MLPLLDRVFIGHSSCRVGGCSLLAVALLSGCATSSSGGAGVSRGATPDAFGAIPAPCDLEEVDPPGSTAFGAIADSASFVRGMAERWEPSWGRIAVTLHGAEEETETGEEAEEGTRGGGDETAAPDEETGTEEGVTVYASIPEADRNWVRERLMEHRTDEPLPEGSRISLLISDEGELAPRTIRRVRTCSPQLTDRHRERMSRELQRLGSRFREHMSAGPLRTHLLVYIEETGRPGEIRIQRRSGSPDFDREAVTLARALRFTPAWIEGQPVPVWLALPVTLESR